MRHYRLSQQVPAVTVGSRARAGLANTCFWIDRARGVGGVYLSQVLPFADKKSLPLFGEFETAVYEFAK